MGTFGVPVEETVPPLNEDKLEAFAASILNDASTVSVSTIHGLSQLRKSLQGPPVT